MKESKKYGKRDDLPIGEILQAKKSAAIPMIGFSLSPGYPWINGREKIPFSFKIYRKVSN